MSGRDYDHEEETRKAMAVVEKYFDVDITNADSAYDVLVDNGVNHEFAVGFAEGMYPPTSDSMEDDD